MRSAITARWRSTVPSSPRAIAPVSAASGPEPRPLLGGGQHERGELRAGDPGGGREPLGAGLERDQEVGRDRARGVVGGAILGARRGWRACPSALASVGGHVQRPLGRAVDRRSGAAQHAGSLPVGTDISGCSENPSRSPKTSSPVAPEQWPSSGPSGTVAATSAILPSGTHSSTTSAASGTGSPRRSAGASDSAAASTVPRRPAPRTEQAGSAWGLFGSSSRIEIPAHIKSYPARCGQRGRIPPSAALFWRHAQRFGAARGTEGRLGAGPRLHPLPTTGRDPHDRRLRLRATPTPT